MSDTYMYLELYNNVIRYTLVRKRSYISITPLTLNVLTVTDRPGGD
jgi:hypothetical protein